MIPDADGKPGWWLAAMRRLASCAGAALLMIAAIAVADGAIAQARLPSKALQALQRSSAAHYKAGNFDKAFADAEKALALAIGEFGALHEQIGIRTYSLGLIADAAAKPDVAAEYYRRSVSVREKIYGPESAGTAQALEMLGRALLKSGRISEAEAEFERVLKIRSELVGPDHAFTAGARANLAEVQLTRQNAQAALEGFRKAVRLLTTGISVQTVARSVDEQTIRQQRSAFIGVARAAWQVPEKPGAPKVALLAESYIASQQAWTTEAASALAKMAARVGAAQTELGRRIREVQDLSERVLALHNADMTALARWGRLQRGNVSYSKVLEEFRQASITQARLNAPFVSRQKELVALLQDLLTRCPPGRKVAGCENAEVDRVAIVNELGKLSSATSAGSTKLMEINGRMQAAEKVLPGYQKFHAARRQRIDEMQRLEQMLGQRRAALKTEFPDYAALSDPKPLSPKDTQGLLGPAEVVVTILTGRSESFVWAVTRERAMWARIEAGEASLAEQVLQLRRGLDPLSEDARTGKSNVVATFDVEHAHALYRLLLGPVAALLAGKQHLIIVPTGPLTSLPFQVLVTDRPYAGHSASEKLRRAKWLIRRHGISVLPSVPSLFALRRLAPVGAAAKPFIGIGDPVLNGPPVAAPVAPGAMPGQQRGAIASRVAATASLYRGGAVDLRALKQLQPLPETAQELRAMARLLGAGEDDLLLREAASEARIKRIPLADYKVVHFATHGLVAGELSGLAEPALVMTPPAKPSREDDGLLRASEVAALKMRADWVVLSACNTAAGNAAGADALSGLARAFFYAGARALLVSHWAVYSDAAVTLTTHTFARMAKNPRIGRAEAFRRTMIEMIDKGEPPSVWAPFVIVGEGAAPRAAKGK